MKEKLIVTIWRAQLTQINSNLPIICRITYGNQSRKTKPAQINKGLIWKQTFVLPLTNIQNLKLDFIRIGQGEQIHYAGESIADSIAFGHSLIPLSIQNSSKGTLPAKSDIKDDNGDVIGKMFIQYEVLKTEVTYIVQKQIDYLYMIKLSNFKVKFIRNLKRVPTFYLKVKFGEKIHKENFPFIEEEGQFLYHYPVKFYIKRQNQFEIQLQVKDWQSIDYGATSNDGSYRTKSITVTSEKATEKSIGKKNPIDLTNDKIISALMDLNFKKNINIIKNLPLSMIVKGGRQEIGSIEFNFQTFFKTKQELDELEEQLKFHKQTLNQPQQIKNKYSPPKNGKIVVNSIIAKLEPFNQELLDGKDFTLQIHLGKQIQFSSVLENPGKELIFIDTYTFRRTWEENMKFILCLHSQNGQILPSYYSSINLRELWELKRFMAKRITIKDEFKNYCGQIIIDVAYTQSQNKKDSSINKTSIETDRQKNSNTLQIIEQRKQEKRLLILERMKKKEKQKQQKKDKQLDIHSILSDRQIILPPLKNRSPQSMSKQTLSPKSNPYIYNRGGSIMFGKSPRFQKLKNQNPDSYFFQRQSSFDGKDNKKGPYIGYGEKIDFTKVYVKNPGVGRYEIPSVWDKYR